ncbi:hypothetical protein OTU49_003779, partial [Cherax quadricarinatus]
AAARPTADDATTREPSHIVYYIMAGVLRRFVPLFDRVLVQKAEAVTKTSSGILIPEKSLAKVLTGKVVAVGEGARTESGSVIPPSVSVGDEVFLPEFGGTKVTLDEKEYHLFRDSELLAKIKKE